jgi:DNA polymerase III delta prime subunit
VQYLVAILVALIGAVATIATALIARSNKQTTTTTDEIAPQAYRHRQILLNKVRNYWVKGVLETSLHDKVLLELGLEERFDAVNHPWGMMWETPEQPRQALPPGMRVIHKFDEMGEGRSLLILGEPGSGKTTTLLELARDLLQQAEQDTDQPIPVVFNLSSWSRQNLADWLAQELNTKYQVSKLLAKTWLRNQQLMLLLDGLDEVATERREACVDAINQFMQQYGQTEIIICSRIRDYEALPNRLNIQGAICIQPLTVEQIHQYLSQSGVEGTICNVFQTNPVLQELAKSPLILNIAVLAYQDLTVETFPKLTLEEQQAYLFDVYIDRMLARRNSDRSYPKEQAKRWLSWLAQIMLQQSQTVFLIERIRFTWLKTQRQKWGYAVAGSMIFGGLFGLIFGISAGIGYGIQRGLAIVPLYILLYIPTQIPNTRLIFAFQQMPSNRLQKMLVHSVFSAGAGLVIGIGFALVIGMNEGFRSGFIISAIACLLTWLMDSLTNGMLTLGMLEPAETLKWSWVNVKSKLIFWLIFGLVGGLHLGLGILKSSLATSLLSGLLFGLSAGLLLGLSSSSEIATKTIPNQGIWQSAKISVIVALIGLLFLSSVATWLAIPIFYGAFFGLVLGAYMGGGACAEHLTLRTVYWWDGHMPWNYTRFLDWATEHLFLQKVGGGYIFIHRSLLEHFAQLEKRSKTV